MAFSALSTFWTATASTDIRTNALFAKNTINKPLPLPYRLNCTTVIFRFNRLSTSPVPLSTMEIRCSVATKKMMYRPGEFVAGKVWICCPVPIPMETVALKITGFEMTQVIKGKMVQENPAGKSSTWQQRMIAAQINVDDAQTGTVE